MRVRIIRPRRGQIDGVNLAQLEVGIAYNLPPTLASYLVLTESADVVDEREPDRPDTMLFHGALPPPSVADDAGMDEDFIEVFERVTGRYSVRPPREMVDVTR